MINLLHGDCLEKLKELADNSVDAIVTDPPYGLSFMNKKWDYEVPSVEIWKEALRVLKPGGHLLSFGGTRTYHRMVVNIEDAGFEIRDCIQWLYGSGFPKSLNIKEGDFKGWGTALKPANEPIVVARKPLEKGLTVAENVVKHGTGAINIDGSRIEFISETDKYSAKPQGRNTSKLPKDGMAKSAGLNTERHIFNYNDNSQGRWPANIILDEFNEDVLILKDNLPEQVYKLIQEFFHDYSEMPSLLERYKNIPKSKNQNEILQQEVLSQGADVETIGDVGKKTFSKIDKQNESISTSECEIRERESDLQGLLYESRISDDSHNGNSRARENQILRNVHDDKQELLRRTQGCDGEIFGSSAFEVGSSSPHERNKNRQSDRKSRTSLSKLSQERALGSIERSKTTPTLIRESDLPQMWREYFIPSGLEVRSKHCAAEMLDEQTGNLGKSQGGNSKNISNKVYGKYNDELDSKPCGFGDSGVASRFFYVAKASKSERNAGLEGMPLVEKRSAGGTTSSGKPTMQGRDRFGSQTQNFHPTVKPIKLMQYLINLITPPNGTVLDPFMGSGSTGVAAKNLNRKFIGIELSQEYFEIAKKRIQLDLDQPSESCNL